MAPLALLSSSSALCFSPSRARRNAGVVLCSSTPAWRIASLRRRDLVLLGLTSSFVLPGPNSGLLAVVSSEQDVKMNTFIDDTNAYSFAYPIELPNTGSSFKWVESRKPERYSSAAPLSPNARQRIVSERLDMINNVVISVSIGPPNSYFLTSNDKSTWKAGDVANSVLSDKSALIPGQRMVESSIIDVHSDNVGNEPYWYYEYIVRKSPTTFVSLLLKGCQTKINYSHEVHGLVSLASIVKKKADQPLSEENSTRISLKPTGWSDIRTLLGWKSTGLDQNLIFLGILCKYFMLNSSFPIFLNGKITN